MDILWIGLGLVGLVLGGDWLVRGAVSVAKALGVSPVVIGLTLVGFGTSTPELVTSLQAALSGAPGIAIGNVVGSNIGNILLILGIGACIAPVVVPRDVLRRDGTVVALATALCVAMVLLGDMGRLAGGLFVLALLGYLALVLVQDLRGAPTPAAEVYAHEAAVLPAVEMPTWRALALALAGLVVTILGARALVAGAVGLAEGAGIPQAVIGLTIVAIGTSLPELVTTVIAMRKGQSDVALGNVLGSNIFNILGILGVTALVQPMQVPAQIVQVDIWVMAAATVLLLLLARSGWRIDRREGLAMLACYAAYLGWLLLP